MYRRVCHINQKTIANRKKNKEEWIFFLVFFLLLPLNFVYAGTLNEKSTTPLGIAAERMFGEDASAGEKSGEDEDEGGGGDKSEEEQDEGTGLNIPSISVSGVAGAEKPEENSTTLRTGERRIGLNGIPYFTGDIRTGATPEGTTSDTNTLAPPLSTRPAYDGSTYGETPGMEGLADWFVRQWGGRLEDYWGEEEKIQEKEPPTEPPATSTEVEETPTEEVPPESVLGDLSRVIYLGEDTTITLRGEQPADKSDEFVRNFVMAAAGIAPQTLMGAGDLGNLDEINDIEEGKGENLRVSTNGNSLDVNNRVGLEEGGLIGAMILGGFGIVQQQEVGPTGAVVSPDFTTSPPGFTYASDAAGKTGASIFSESSGATTSGGGVLLSHTHSINSFPPPIDSSIFHTYTLANGTTVSNEHEERVGTLSELQAAACASSHSGQVNGPDTTKDPFC